MWLQRVASQSPRGVYPHPKALSRYGSVAEWFKALVLKTSVGGTLPWVRIPPLPPLALAKAFSRSGCGRIFPLFSRVMRVGLLTGPRPEGRTSVLSGPIVMEHRDEYQSEAAALTAIAGKLGCSPDSLRVWMRQVQRDGGERPGPTSAEVARIKELERENRELRQANEILRKASAYFAQAELDRPFRK